MALAVLLETEEKNKARELKNREEIRMIINARRNCFPTIPPTVKARKKKGRVVARRRAEKRKEERTLPKITVKGLRGETKRKARVFCSLSPVMEPLEKAGETMETKPNKINRSPAKALLFSDQGVSDLRTK